MSEILYGLPSNGPAQGYLNDLADRSGYLDLWGWTPQSKQGLTALVKDLVDSGSLVMEKDPARGAYITNPASRLTGEFRVCTEPVNLRHGARNRRLSADVVEEINFLNNTKWKLNDRMMEMWSVACEDPSFKEETDKLNKLVTTWKFLKTSGISWFHQPVFLDKVGRAYHEGMMSITGSKVIRSLLDGQSIHYTVERSEKIAKLLGFDPADREEVLRDWKTVLKTEGWSAGWNTIRVALFLDEVRKNHRSGAMFGCDIRTSGPLIGGILAGCMALLLDTNIWTEDGRDLRSTIANRIQVPKELMPWADWIKSKDCAKAILTAVFYGQAAGSAADHMLWDDPTEAPVGWKNFYTGEINEALVLKFRRKWNENFAEMIDKLGPTLAYQQFGFLAESYTNTFWRSYPEVRVLRDRLDKAFSAWLDAVPKDDGASVGPKPPIAPTFVGPNGWQYTHTKWVCKSDERWEMRFHSAKTILQFKSGVSISFAGLENVAGGFSLFVRLVHMADAWFRHMVNRKLARLQKSKFGGHLGGGSVHDFWLVHAELIPFMHGIVRSVIHEMTILWPDIINKFLLDNGQEPMKGLSVEQTKKMHKCIAKNRAFLQLG